MSVPIKRPVFDVVIKLVLATVLLIIADRIFTLYDYFWEIILTGAAVAAIGLILDFLVLPRIGSFASLYVDKMAFLIVISLLSLGLSSYRIVPFYVAEAVAVALALFEEWLHRAIKPTYDVN